MNIRSSSPVTCGRETRSVAGGDDWLRLHRLRIVDATVASDGPDELIHQPIRLRILAALTALDRGEDGLDFARLKSLTGATDGNLGAHLDQLVRAGYVEATKAFVARRPRTTVKATAQGRTAFKLHVAFLKAIIAEA
jgi:DNA-binding MarR family transcriptional regulator